MQRVLILAPRPCLPADTGAKLRNYHLARQLAARMDVTFVAFEEAGVSAAADMPAVCDRVVLLPRRAGYGPVSLLKGLAGRDPITVVNYTTPLMLQTLREMLAKQTYDIVQIEGLPLTGYVSDLRTVPKPPLIVLDWHNIDSENMRRYSETEPRVPRRWYAHLTAGRIESAERRALANLDAHLCVSRRDQDKMLEWAPAACVRVIENGVDVNWYANGAAHSASRVLFVGSMDYYANIDAVTWFANEVWPAVRQQRPDLQFTIVGRSPGAKVRELGTLPGVVVTGTVDDVRPFYRDALASIVPLRSGGGSRLKILESMAAGVPVVSTTLGAEGIEIEDGVNIRLADTASDLAAALVRVSTSSEEQRRLAGGGLRLVREKYDWSILGERLAGFYSEMLDRRRVAGA